MKIKQKLIIWFVTISLFTGLVGFMGLYANNHIVKSFESGEQHFGSIIEASNEVSSYAKRAQGHTMLFLTLHNETDRKKAFMRIAALREQSSIIEGNITNPEARQILENIKYNTNELQSIMELLFKEHDNEIKTTGRFEFENYDVHIRKLDDIAAGIRADGLKLMRVEVKLQSELQESAKKKAEFLYNIILIMSIGAFVGASGLGYIFARNISGSVMKLEDTVIKIGNGNFDSRIEINSKDEFGKLANTINNMAGDLQRSSEEHKRAQEIQKENEILAFASKTKSDFLANMSHELRTPLNSIIGFSELLKKNSHGELNPKQQHYIDNVIVSSNFLLALINDILDLSKVEAGKIELVIEKSSIQGVINETLSLIKEKALKHNVVLNKELDPELPQMDIDKQRVKQILFNLLSNAVKFSKPEGGTVTVTAKKEGDFARFSVSDTGIGIKEENMRKLFKEFEQLDTGTSRKYGGTGLGLAISKRLVELHRGKIWVESKYGEGTTFIFILPLVAKTGGKIGDKN